MKYIIICTIGRSGSTLLQGILNSIDDCCIRGENKNFLFGLYQSYESLNYASTRMTPARLPTNPWYGADELNPIKFTNWAKTAFDDQISAPAGTAISGFKEIRWAQEFISPFSLTDYLSFISIMLGDVSFILLTRDTKEIFVSQKNAGFAVDESYSDFDTKIKRFYDEMRFIKLKMFEIDYKDLEIDNKKLIKLYDFIGQKYDRTKIFSVLNQEHSYANLNYINKN